jgi:dCTP diphosphatase
MSSNNTGESSPSLSSLAQEIREFGAERDWEQFHTPRNLMLALVGEVGELAEQMQWVSDDEILSRMKLDPGPIEEEVADVAIYLLRLSDVLGVDLTQAIERKMEANRDRYEPTRFKGSSKKAPRMTKDADDREDKMKERGSR